MTNASSSSDRLAQIKALLQQSVIASNERMTRFEAGLEETRQLVHSNNRFLGSFSQDLRKYTESMNNLATRIDGVIATNNQDRQQTNSRLSVIEPLVRVIATPKKSSSVTQSNQNSTCLAEKVDQLLEQRDGGQRSS